MQQTGRAGIKANFAGYIGRLINEDSGILKNGLLQGVLLDSWECKTQTWTPKLDSLFQKNGIIRCFQCYRPYLATLSIIPKKQRVLRDWRVTLNDLLVNNFSEK